MKTVFNTDMVAHVWAQQEQGTGRNAQGNFYFRDSTIYSYGAHFPIARFVTNAKGKRAVLFTEDTYSNTTAGHKRAARQAIPPGVPVYYVPRVADVLSPSDTRDKLRAKLERLYGLAVRAKSRVEWAQKAYHDDLENANALAQFMGWGWRIKSQGFIPEAIAKAKEAAAKEVKRKAKETAARNKACAEATRVAIVEWRNGERYSIPGYVGPVLLRLTPDGQTVQTSKGAEVPAEHARRVWKLVDQCKKESSVFELKYHTERIGAFTVDRIDADGTLHAGCHTIAYSEMEAFSAVLNRASV